MRLLQVSDGIILHIDKIIMFKIETSIVAIHINAIMVGGIPVSLHTYYFSEVAAQLKSYAYMDILCGILWGTDADYIDARKVNEIVKSTDLSQYRR